MTTVNGTAPHEHQWTVEDQMVMLEALNLTLQERILELEIDDIGWEPIDQFNQGKEFSRDGLQKIINRSRLFFLSNPLINRAVTLQSYYVWGQGITLTAPDPDTKKIIDAWWEHPKNRAEFTGHQARTMKEQDLQVEGNIFFVLFPDVQNETFYVRTLPVGEITDIICNPDDRREVWYYKRVYAPKQFDMASGTYQSVQAETVYYPDWQYYHDNPTKIASVIGRHRVLRDAPIYHVKVGGLSDMAFGVPETYQALDWVKAYRQFLEDWATIQRSLARFAWHGKTEGGTDAVNRLRERLASTVTQRATESNPSPATASTFVSTPGVAMTPIRTAGATTGAEEGRRLLLMVCAATGFPETFYGDVSVGTLATAKSLDRPTELKFKDRQTLWRDIIQDFITYLFDIVGVPENDQRNMTVEFPSILEHDVEAQVNAIVKGSTLDGKQLANTVPPQKTAELILTALGVQNVNEIISDMEFPEASEIETEPQQQQDTPNPNVSDVESQPVPVTRQQAQEAFEESARILYRILAEQELRNVA